MNIMWNKYIEKACWEINKLKLYKKNNYKKYIETYLKRKSNKLGIQEIVEYIKIYFNYDK